MSEPLKNLYTEDCIESVANEISKVYRSFDKKKFIDDVFDKEWKEKELKDRMKHISCMLKQYLPKDYKKSVKVLKKVVGKFTGFQYMFFPGFIELYGMDDYETSVDALEAFTEFSSSEFAVRPFIKQYEKKMMKQMKLWAKSKNHHVRRLASEGCRPRLPWAMALPEFKKDPSEVLPILEQLKTDESEYVRKSVANNLNDISKDNPDLVIKLAKRWLGKNDKTNWIVKHACRTLLKQGNTEVMKLFGLRKPEHVKVKKFKLQKSVQMGEALTFSFSLESETERLGNLRIEYAIGFLRKNGELSLKVFKISESVVDDNIKEVNKSYSFKKISTRKYYPGKHKFTLIINGYDLKSTYFELNS